MEKTEITEPIEEKQLALWLEQYASQLDQMAEIEHTMSMYERGFETS